MKKYRNTSHISQSTEFQPYATFGEPHRGARIAFKKPDVTAREILFTPAHLILTLLISLSPHGTKNYSLRKDALTRPVIRKFQTFSSHFCGCVLCFLDLLAVCLPPFLFSVSMIKLTKYPCLHLEISGQLKSRKTKTQLSTLLFKLFPVSGKNNFIISGFRKQ